MVDVTELRSELEAKDQQIKASEARLALALEAANMGIYERDLQSGVVSWSPQAKVILGYKPGVLDESFEGFLKRMHPDDLNRFKTEAMQAVSEGRSVNIEYRFNKPDGQQVWLHAFGKAMVDSTGKPQRAFGVLQDITAQKETEENLRTSEEKFSKMFQLAPVTFAVVKLPEGTIVEVNKAWEKLFGYTKEEAVGKTSIELGFYPDIKQRELIYSEFAKYGTVRNIETTLRTKSGELRILSNNMDLLIIGGEHFILGTVTDITEQRRFEESLKTNQAQLEASFQAISDGVMLFDFSGKVILVNEAEAKICGYPTKEAMIKNLDYFSSVFELRDLAGNIVSVPDWPVSRVLRGESVQGVELAGKRRDTGQSWFFSFSGEPVRDSAGHLILAVLITRDITKQKQAEAQLIKAKEQAEIANSTKSAFLANMSHEIRTPLGVILGFTELMKDPSLSKEEKDQFLDTISRNGKTLIRIIDDILDLAKVESGKIEVEQVEFSLLNLMDEVINLFSESAKIKNLYLRLNVSDEVPVTIYSDPTRLRQILINIIGNAIKFTKEGGITIQVDSKPATAGAVNVVIKVRDTGIGIAPQDREKLFEPFTQADNTMTRKFGGTGLGLSLSVRLAKALGGDIQIEDTEPAAQGSTFIITFKTKSLPPSKTQSTAKPEEKPLNHSDKQPLKGYNILVADDSQDNQLLMKQLLQKNGANVTVAKNGREAYQMALIGHYDLILMDLQMPEMDGYEATEALLKAGFKEPIIALTAHAMTEEQEKTKAAGFVHHLTKPIQLKLLLSTIKRFPKK